MMEVFLLPWTLAQYIFSLGVWVFAISFIRQTDTYYKIAEWSKEKLNEARDYFRTT